MMTVTLLIFLSQSCTGQVTPPRQAIRGPFENREFFGIGMPDSIGPTDTTADWHQGTRQLIIRGKILQQDGITPAPGVVLYYYHTDGSGHYRNGPKLDPRVARHGVLRGWVKSDEAGDYAIHTVRPAPYPGGTDPAHLHPAVWEPGLPEPYYLDEFVFDDDPLITTARRLSAEKRGGSGVLRTERRGGLEVATHNIILGLNIPHHPAGKRPVESGLPVGYDIPSFTPEHVWGPDAGTTACPICKYGRYLGILYFIGPGADWSEVARWLTFLESESRQRNGELKVFLIDGDAEGLTHARRSARLTELANRLELKEVALTLVPSLTDVGSKVSRLQLDPSVATTLMVYRNSNVIGNFSHLPADRLGQARVLEVLPDPE